MKCISISFKTAPEHIRNVLSFTNSQKENFLEFVRTNLPELKLVLLSTCGRTELYESSKENTFKLLEELLCRKAQIDVRELRKYAKYCRKDEAVRHLYKVTSGIDSMVVGENEILSQIKDAYRLSKEYGLTDYTLNTSFLGAVTCAKKIKTETEISKSATSVATLACSAAFQFIKDQNIKSPSILIIGGSGKVGTAIIKNLKNKKEKNIRLCVTKRTHGVSVEYLETIDTIDYTKRFEALQKNDIIISATQSPHYTLTKDSAEKFLQDGKPRLFIDLAVPFDIERKIKDIRNSTLITVDDLKVLADDNNRKKLKAIAEAKIIIEKELDKLYIKTSVKNTFSSLAPTECEAV